MDKYWKYLDGASLTPRVLWFDFLRMRIMQPLSFVHIALRLFYLSNKTCATSRDVLVAGIFSFLYTRAETVWVENMVDNLVRMVMGDRISVIPHNNTITSC